MAAEMIRPRRLGPTAVNRLQSIDHGIRNAQQSQMDMAGMMGGLATAHQVAALVKAQGEMRTLVSGERRAYAAEHAEDRAGIAANRQGVAEVKANVKEVETKLQKHADHTSAKLEKINGSINRGVGAIAAIGTTLAIIKLLLDHGK